MEKKIGTFLDYLKKNIKYIILLLCLILFLEVLLEIFEEEVLYRDILGYKIVSSFIGTNTIPFFKVITEFGGPIFIVVAIILSFIFIKNKRISTYIFLNMVFVTSLNQILKRIIRRDRPVEYRLANASGYSFPSGHSMACTAFYGLLIFLIYRNVKNKKLKSLLISLCVLMIGLIGMSRIFLGVHYTSDVLAGIFLSVSYLIVYTSFYDWFMNVKFKKNTKEKLEK